VTQKLSSPFVEVSRQSWSADGPAPINLTAQLRGKFALQHDDDFAVLRTNVSNWVPVLTAKNGGRCVDLLQAWRALHFVGFLKPWTMPIAKQLRTRHRVAATVRCSLYYTGASIISHKPN